MRDGQKKLTIALDGETYRRLRQGALDLGKTGQALMETAVKEYLARLDLQR